jgi:hypothetical protein
VDHWLDFADRSGLVPAPGPFGPDEVLLMALGYGQHHLMVTTGKDEVIHAHAGLRRVVQHRRDHSSCICAKWRVNASEQG